MNISAQKYPFPRGGYGVNFEINRTGFFFRAKQSRSLQFRLGTAEGNTHRLLRLQHERQE